MRGVPAPDSKLLLQLFPCCIVGVGDHSPPFRQSPKSWGLPWLAGDALFKLNKVTGRWCFQMRISFQCLLSQGKTQLLTSPPSFNTQSGGYGGTWTILGTRTPRSGTLGTGEAARAGWERDSIPVISSFLELWIARAPFCVCMIKN